MSPSSPVDRYAVMGNPVAHSQSPAIHTLFAKQTGQAMRYDAIHVEPGDFETAVKRFAEQGGCGLNITVPFKQEAWTLCDQRSERAEIAGAVNTLHRRDDAWFGDNTDGIGLVRDLQTRFRQSLQGLSILIIGAGGAVRGVLSPLLEQQPDSICICNRTASRAIELAKQFSPQGTLSGTGFDDIPKQVFDIIINGTSASLQGELPPLPSGIVARHSCCYDMMYAARPTPFMDWGKKQGADLCLDGLGMLVEQAAESFYIWRGIHPQTAAVITAIRQRLSAQGN